MPEAISYKMNPCPNPWCGGEAKVRKREWQQSPFDGYCTRWYIKCLRCGVAAPERMELDEAIKEWNAGRPSTAALNLASLHLYALSFTREHTSEENDQMLLDVSKWLADLAGRDTR